MKNMYRFRLILPAFSHFNIYSRIARTTTALGPLCVAASAGALDSWEAEVIDENNCRRGLFPRDKQGRLDHVELQRERPADVVGFYGSLSSTAPRIYALARLYRGLGVKTVAGGKHVENLPLEALENGLDAVVLGEGEHTIKELLLAWQDGQPLDSVAGIVFNKDATAVKTKERPLTTNFDELADPDFDLLRYAKMKYYPIGRIRGCNMHCEFCAVKDRTREASVRKIVNQIINLVETRKAKKFFEVSDHFAADRATAIEFCRSVADYKKRTGARFTMTVQLRINDAADPELLGTKDAGINNLAIGFESPIDEELKSMRKGYSSKDMIRWTETLHRYGFFIHGMFIFGYPRKEQSSLEIPLAERTRRFRDFLTNARIDTVQVLLPVPLPGTDLRDRLAAAGRLYPLSEIGWEYYDGQFPLFEPDDGVSPQELQSAVPQIMGRIYRFQHLLKLILNVVIHFPRMVFVASLSIVTFRVRHIVRAYHAWKNRYFRNDFVRFGGFLLLKSWLKNFKQSKFPEYLARATRKLQQFKIEGKTRGSLGAYDIERR